tara:strand:+ start:255 stop:560 length:306 start_codon:yes stop_codon:yes gene_type:complete
MNKIKQQIKDLNLVAEDHWLKPRLQQSSAYSHDMAYAGGRKTNDYKNISDDIRLVGTLDQISKFWKDNDFEIKDSWNAEVTEKHLNGYISNDHNLLLIKLV